jgi:hypothetical protein
MFVVAGLFVALVATTRLIAFSTRALRGAPEAWMGLSVALVIGAGFGILEHAISYSSEEGSAYAWRVVFHAGTTVMSMACYRALMLAPDVRARWGSTLAASVVHFINNAGVFVLVQFVVAAGGSLDHIDWWWTYPVMVLMFVLLIASLAAPAGVRSTIQSLVRRLPASTAPR